MKKLIPIGIALALSLNMVACTNTEINTTNDVNIENATQKEDGEESLINKVAMDNEYCKITILYAYKCPTIYSDAFTTELTNSVNLQVKIENKSDKDITVWANEVNLNSKMISISNTAPVIKPGCYLEESWTLYDSDDKILDIPLDQISGLNFTIEVQETTNYETIAKNEITLN